MVEDYGNELDEKAQKYLQRIRSEAQRMGLLIDDLLQLSRITRADMRTEAVDLSLVASIVAERLRETHAGRTIEFSIEPGLQTSGDPRLLEIALTNLLGNSVKFSATRAEARIAVGRAVQNGQKSFFVRDNGVGFDMKYAGMLFGAFQRLHKAAEFPGSGIGLATVQRIVRRHGGRIWADAKRDAGATFYFTLEDSHGQQQTDSSD
jgi:light-regulated signal transduction histidine kinase (bacteriophytochrome)